MKYGTIIICKGVIKAIFENSKADHKTLFPKYVIFEPPRLYFYPMTYICSHFTFLVPNGLWQSEPTVSSTYKGLRHFYQRNKPSLQLNEKQESDRFLL